MAARTRAATLAGLGAGLLLVTACADEEPEPLADTGGELIRIETTIPPTAPTTAAPPTTVPSTDPPVDPMTGCLDWYRFKIEAGDGAVVAFWQDELEEDLVQLVAECERLVAEDPPRVAEMIEENRRIDEFLRQATATTTSA